MSGNVRAGSITLPGQVGRILSGMGIAAMAAPLGFAPRGIYLVATGGLSADVLVQLGTGAGGRASRRIAVGPRGAWLSVAGWEVAGVEVLAVGDATTQVAWAWTATEPTGYDLLRIEVLDSSGGTVAVPEGARKLAVSGAIAGWTWRTNVAGVNLDIAQALAAGAFVDIQGTHFINVTPGIVGCWQVEPI